MIIIRECRFDIDKENTWLSEDTEKGVIALNTPTFIASFKDKNNNDYKFYKDIITRHKTYRLTIVKSEKEKFISKWGY